MPSGRKVIAVLFHPLNGKINDQSLSEEAYLGTIYLLNGDVVRLIKSVPDRPKVVRIGVQRLVGNPLAPAVNQHSATSSEITLAKIVGPKLGQMQRCVTPVIDAQ